MLQITILPRKHILLYNNPTSVLPAAPPPVDTPVEHPSGDDFTYLCSKPADCEKDKEQTKANYNPVTFEHRKGRLEKLPEKLRQIDKGTETIIASYILFLPQSTVMIQERPSKWPLHC